ncbi:MAG: hypothetical protein J6333_01730 [Planctomycetes bacterium]|nr:hypothetical protein [Planctomycetota bacterium]
MKMTLGGLGWEFALGEILFDSYLDFGAPATFYIRDCVPQGLIKHIDAEMWGKYDRPLLYVNNTGNPGLSLQDQDFLLVTPQGIVTRTAKTEKIRQWEKIATTYTTNQAKYAEARWPEVADTISKKMADSLAGEIVDEDTRELMPRLLRRIVRVLVGVDGLPPARLPYLSLPSATAVNPAGEKAVSASPAPRAAKENDKYQVDF